MINGRSVSPERRPLPHFRVVFPPGARTATLPVESDAPYNLTCVACGHTIVKGRTFYVDPDRLPVCASCSGRHHDWRPLIDRRGRNGK